MHKFCRGCLVRYEETELYQYTERNRRLFVYATGLQVKCNDTFTFQLCKDCYLSMKVACNFRKQCRNSDKKFKSYLAQKETDESLDLPTFLKNNEDSWNFRFPPIFESSTPAYHRNKDDDNESTTASIRNFIIDIMPEADLPDSEARIVREVIQEHDDVLDDSLDSHWLQDDASIDNDFKLDFSFSPFSTPRAPNNDIYSPKKIAVNKSIYNTNQNQKYLAMKKAYTPLINDEVQSLIPVKVEKEYEEIGENDHLDALNDLLKSETDNLNVAQEMPGPRCTIDKNLEAALRDTNNTVFALDDLLVSPKVIPEIQSTKCLLDTDLFEDKIDIDEKNVLFDEKIDIDEKNILFDEKIDIHKNNVLFVEKIDIDENSNDSQKYKAGRHIESYQNVEGDVRMDYLEDLDMKDTFDLEDSETEPIDTKPKDVKIPEITSFYCKMCEKTFKSLKGMKRHAAWHNTGRLRILINKDKFTCEQCGIQLKSRTNLMLHLKIHKRPPQPNPICDICKSEFSSKGALIVHLKSHTAKKPDTSKKKYVCPDCGLSTNKSSNLAVHMLRHQKKFTFHCEYCEKGFYRKAELTIHTRYHTGEKPFLCDYCNKGFVRRDALTRHVKNHLDLKPFKCKYCKSRFVNSTNLKNHYKSSKICAKTRDKIVRDQDKMDEGAPAVNVDQKILVNVDAY